MSPPANLVKIGSKVSLFKNFPSLQPKSRTDFAPISERILPIKKCLCCQTERKDGWKAKDEDEEEEEDVGGRREAGEGKEGGKEGIESEEEGGSERSEGVEGKDEGRREGGEGRRR